MAVLFWQDASSAKDCRNPHAAVVTLEQTVEREQQRYSGQVEPNCRSEVTETSTSSANGKKSESGRLLRWRDNGKH